MSNFLTPATVTAALALLLDERIAEDVTDFAFTVTIGRPDEAADDSAGVNVYLYQVTPNVQWRNADLPTRNTRGDLLQRPRAALDLHYLLTFTGTESELQAQRLLGSAAHILHGQPVVTRDWIDFVRAHPDYPFLAASDLGNEIERVKLTPQPFSLEELSKLWSVFFQTTYQLSMAYVASVVFVEAQEPITAGLPVAERVVTAIPSAEATTITPPNQLTDLALWLRSDLGVTFDSNGVSGWDDQSGNDRHAAQDDVGQRPHFVAHGLGNLPVLRFDGSDDRLALNWSLNAPISGTSVWAVVRTTAGAAQTIASFDSGVYWALQLSDGAPSPRIVWQTGGNDLNADRAFDDTQWHVIAAQFDAAAPSDKQLSVDGIAVGAVAAHGGNIGGALRFGLVGAATTANVFDGAPTGAFFAGDLAELVVFNRALTTTEQVQLERYFAQRYG